MSAAKIIARMRANTARYCERFKVNHAASVPASVTVVAFAERAPMAPRGLAAIITKNEQWLDEYIAVLHRPARLGRCGRRPARQPRYKNVRRGFARHAR